MYATCHTQFFKSLPLFTRLYNRNVQKNLPNVLLLEKWFPLQGELAHSLKLFCMYDKRFEISKTKYNGGGNRTTDLTIYPRLKYSPPYKYIT